MSRSGRTREIDGRATSTRQPKPRWTNPTGSPIAVGILRGVRVRVGQVCGKAGSLSHTEGGGEHQNRFEPIARPEFVRSGSPDSRRPGLHGAAAGVQRQLPYRSARAGGLKLTQIIFRHRFRTTVAQDLPPPETVALVPVMRQQTRAGPTQSRVQAAGFDTRPGRQARIPKHEIRNKHESRNSGMLQTKLSFEFLASNLFRASCFGFRASLACFLTVPNRPSIQSTLVDQ